MVRLVLYFIVVALFAAAFAWLADRPGSLVIEWQGYIVETSVFRAVVLFVAFVGAILFVWSLLRNVWQSPAVIARFVSSRQRKRGLDALSSGMIAIGAGDRVMATRYALHARKSLPNEPLTHLLRAQAAQLSGDKITARRIFEAMLASPDTEQLGLRGLYVEAEREGEREAARQFAERALRLNAKLAWPVEELFKLQCRQADWAGALDTLAIARRAHNVSKLSGDRRRAVLLTAQAQKLEDGDPDRALTLALDAHGLAPDLVPAAVIAGRLLASRGNTPRATRIIERTWVRSPHPDLALVHAYARIGDSPRDRLDRVRRLAALTPNSLEGSIAVATEAVDARAFDEARAALTPLLDGRLTQRVAILMARIEGEQHGDKGRVREWLARAVNARRDPAWTADGVVSDEWAPVSTVTGALDAFQWRVPVETLDPSGNGRAAEALEKFVTLGAATSEPVPVTAVVVSPGPVKHQPPATTEEPMVVAQDESDAPPPAADIQTEPPSEMESSKVETPGRTHAGEAKTVLPARIEEPRSRPVKAEAGADHRPGLAPPERQTASAINGVALVPPEGAFGATPLDPGPRGAADLDPGQPPDAPRQPHILVPHRAPDDPGPEPGDFDDDRFRPGLVRTSS